MGIYPAIDVTTSVSRVMNDITDADQQAAASRFRRLVSLYMENRDLILMGGYTPGQDPDLDLAVELWPTLTKHIQQPEAEKANFEISRDALIGLMRNA
jgi:flagellum-specific ATP synthase